MAEHYCEQCGKAMPGMEGILFPVCAKCVRENHLRACGRWTEKEQKLADRRRRTRLARRPGH